MHDHPIVVDYREDLVQRHWGQKINAKNLKSNRAWSCEMDVNNAYCPVPLMNLTPSLFHCIKNGLNGCVERESVESWEDFLIIYCMTLA